MMDAQDGYEQRRAKAVDKMRNLLTQYAVLDKSGEGEGSDKQFVRVVPLLFRMSMLYFIYFYTRTVLYTKNSYAICLLGII